MRPGNVLILGGGVVGVGAAVIALGMRPKSQFWISTSIAWAKSINSFRAELKRSPLPLERSKTSQCKPI